MRRQQIIGYRADTDTGTACTHRSGTVPIAHSHAGTNSDPNAGSHADSSPDADPGSNPDAGTDARP